MKLETLTLKTIISKLDFLKKTVIIQWNTRGKDLQFFATKLTEKILYLGNAKEHYQLFIRKKNTKLVKQSRIITQQPKMFEKPNIVDIKSIII